MTNEQAKFLYSIADSMGTTGIEDFTCKDGEKMREIINALEQSTSDDCVSREQALLSLTGENLSTKSAEELIALFDKRIKALPPVTPTHGTCKDCRYWYSDNGLTGSCYKRLNITRHDYDDYCIDFTKRGNENEIN